MVNKFMKTNNLKPFKNLNQTFSDILQIGVVPKDFDFPAKHLNSLYHSFGPFVETREQVPFSWEKLDNRPLIYVSMGTIRNSINKIYDALLPALAEFTDYQIVISKGAWTGDGILLDNIPSNVLVVEYAPQIELLKRAALCITHSGPGTVLESLYFGVPMVCIPVSDDQPAMAARVKFHCIGEVIPWRKISKKRLVKSIFNVLNNNSYRARCMVLSEKIRLGCGVDKAVDLIEKVLKIK